MAYPHKIATCCYCGTRAALVLRGRDNHELSCSKCGAPLHDLKRLPKDRTGDRELVERRRPAISHQPPPKAYKPVKSKRRKGLLRKLLEEAVDLVEDIFD
jgi:hypothetical protein